MHDKKFNCFISPLNWGLGHASRSCAIIDEILYSYPKANIILGADGPALEFYKKKYPNLKLIHFKGATVKYPKGKGMNLKMLLFAPRFMRSIEKEHRDLKKIIKKHKIDFVISDNRYGLFCKTVKTAIISHQLNIIVPQELNSFGKILNAINHRYLKKFDEIWVPDHKDELNLSGRLSHPASIPVKYLGPLSRFEKGNSAEEKKFDVFGIISGPEPQRTIFETILLEQIKKLDIRAAILLGQPGGGNRTEGKIDIYSHTDDKTFKSLLSASELIISRSGYSTLMDLSILGGKAFFIPTPGQTEQEYLAKELKEKSIADFSEQSNFNLSKAIASSKDFKGFQTGSKSDISKFISIFFESE